MPPPFACPEPHAVPRPRLAAEPRAVQPWPCLHRTQPSSGPGVDTAALDDELTSLAQRSFLYRGDGPPRTITSRHTLSFLRGPLTRAEISRLGPATTFAAAEMFHASLSAPPVCPEGLPARWLDPAMPRPVVLAGADDLWRPALLARWAARFDDPGWVEDRVVHQLLFPADDPEAIPVAVEVPDASILRTAPPAVGTRRCRAGCSSAARWRASRSGGGTRWCAKGSAFRTSTLRGGMRCWVVRRDVAPVRRTPEHAKEGLTSRSQPAKWLPGPPVVLSRLPEWNP